MLCRQRETVATPESECIQPGKAAQFQHSDETAENEHYGGRLSACDDNCMALHELRERKVYAMRCMPERVHQAKSYLGARSYGPGSIIQAHDKRTHELNEATKPCRQNDRASTRIRNGRKARKGIRDEDQLGPTTYPAKYDNVAKGKTFKKIWRLRLSYANTAAMFYVYIKEHRWSPELYVVQTFSLLLNRVWPN